MPRQVTPSILDDVLTTDVVKPSTVHLDSIRIDGGTQPRDGINAAYVDELVEALQAGATLPPVDVMYDGAAYWLYDGFHRVAAHRQANYLVVPATIHQGTQVEAQWLSYAANQTHGLRRSNDDKQRAIKAALRHPKAQGMADAAIARHLGVSDKTVTRHRQDMEASSEIPKITERTVTRGETTYTMQTERIGAKPGPVPQPIPSPTAKEYTAAVQAAQPARAYWTPDAPPVPGWDDTDEAEYRALLPTWQQPAGQFNSIVELSHITRRRVAERLSLERLDNLRHSLQERRRELWLEERRQERDASAISNQQSPISNPATPATQPPAQPSTTWTDADVVYDYEIDDELAELVRQANTSLDGQIHSVFPGSAAYWAEQVSEELGRPVTQERMAEALQRLLRHLQEQRAEQPGFVPIKATDDRIPRADTLIAAYEAVQAACQRAAEYELEYERLVGTPSDLLAANRCMRQLPDALAEPVYKLRHLIETLENPAA